MAVRIAARTQVVTVGLVCASLLTRVALAAPPAAGPPASDEELNAKGVTLRLAGDNKGALEPFQQAYDLTHSPRATAQLGLVHQALGRWDLAETLVTKAVESRNDPWIAKYESELTKALQTIHDHVAHVELVSDPADAVAFINGNSIGHLPLPAAIPVVIGQADIELRAPGYRNTFRTLTLKAYQYERLFVRLEREPVAAAGATGELVHVSDGHVATAAVVAEKSEPKAAAPATDGSSGSGAGVRRPIKWTSLGLAGAALGTGIVATVIRSNKVDEFRNAKCRDDGGRGVDLSQMPVPECQNLLSAYTTARTWQIVGFVGAGAFAAAWLVLHLTEQPETSTTAGGAVRTHAWVCVPSLADRGAACTLSF